jgi:hypothetical protein
LSDITVYPYEHFPKLECVPRKCEECGVNKGLKDVITLLQDQISKDIHIVEWDKWKSMKITNKKTTEIQSKKVFVKHSTFTHLSHKQPLKVCLSTVLTFLGFSATNLLILIFSEGFSFRTASCDSFSDGNANNFT